MSRLYSSISVETILSGSITSSQTSMVVATGTGSALLGGVTLAAGNVDQFTIAIDPDTVNEEIVFITGNSGDTFTIVRGRAGSTAITHASGATVRHVLTSDDLIYFNTAVQPSTLTTKGDTFVATAASTVTRLAAGADGTVLTADSTQTKGIKWATPATGSVTSITAGTGLSGGTITTTGTIAIDTATTVDKTTAQTLSNKTLTTPIINQPKTYIGYTAKTATYTVGTGDEGYLFSMNNAATQQFNIPTDATFNFAIGTVINFVWITGAGQPTIGATTPGTTTISSTAGVTPKLRVANSAASAIKLAANSWLVVGDIA